MKKKPHLLQALQQGRMTERNIVREKEHILGDGKISSVLKEKPVLLSSLV